MKAADNNGMQDWAADFEGEGQEQAARDGRDSEVVEDGGGGRRRLRRKMKAADDKGSADNNSL
jgi:hypothetical protein